MLRLYICIFCFLFCCDSFAVTKDVILKLGLPVVFIETDTGENPTSETIYDDAGVWMGVVPGEKLTGRIWIEQGDSVLYDSGTYLADSMGMTIRVRGNSTALRDKKPYKVKLQKKADLLRRGDKRFNNKHWVLLKRGYSTDDMIGFEVNRIVGMPYRPSYEYVNLFLNGEYRGLYTIAENVKRDTDCRIDVDKKQGFIVELDAFHRLADFYFMTTRSPMGFTYKYPDADEVDSLFNERVKADIQLMENSVVDGTYDDKIDINSWARYLLATDIIAASDHYGCNMFYAKHDDSDSSKVFFPCLWDFDSVKKNDGKWGCKHEVYLFDQLLVSSNPAFFEAYKRLWDEKSDSIFTAIDVLLDSLLHSDVCKAIDASMPYDPEWHTGRGTYTQQLQWLQDFFTQRRQWIDAHIGEIRVYDAVDHQSAADGGQVEEKLLYYDLTGRRVVAGSRLRKGIYIKNGKKIVE